MSLAAASVAMAGVVILQASSPRFFRAGTQAEFLRGEVENLSIDDRGQLVLGLATELVYETATPFLWSVVPGPDGSLFVGTGNEGRVYRIDAKGTGTLFFDAAELEVHALAPAPDGGLFVGTSPEGKIYKIDRAGTARTFFEPGERYIWALATDRSGALFAATGEKGNIYRIAPDGSGARFYQAGAVHATALTFDTAGNLLVGTGSPGRVLRVSADGRGFVLLDSPFREISALHLDGKDMLYVAATNGTGSSTTTETPRADEPPSTTGGAPGAPVAIVTTEVTMAVAADASVAPASSGTSSNDTRLPKGAVYRIAADGLWDELWESREDAPYDVAFDTSGRLIIATGSQGKIFRLDGEPPQPTLLARAAAQQVTALHRDGAGQLYYATSNPGKLMRIASERSVLGTYVSEVHDARTVSRWGLISWRASTPTGGRVEVFTRSGNTEAQDDTWSPWSAAHVDPAGSPVTSPNARFLQWRVVLSGKGESPVLTSVTSAYLQRNLRPQVQSITVHPPGIVFQRPFTAGEPDLAGFENQTTPDRRLEVAAASPQGPAGSPPLGRRAYQKSLQTLIWRANDENDDDLEFVVQYRREGTTSWTVLRDDLAEPILVWDTTTVLDGTYFVKIVASDAPSNAPALALTGEMVGTAFDIDNTPPRIATPVTRLDGKTTVITFEVADDHSTIQTVEYSQDGLRWRGAFPVDGLADSRLERYEIRVDGTIGPRELSIRASDSMNNGASAQVRPTGL
jgi:hypothetical protein